MPTLSPNIRRPMPRPFAVGEVSYGRALFALRAFDRDEVITVVRGEVIEDPEYGSDYCIDLGGSLSLEPAAPYCYLNHSCTPNCCLSLDDETPTGRLRKRPQVVLQALKPIRPGQQLTIDYAWPAECAIPCACRSRRCRGWIVDADELKRIRRRAR